MASIANDPNGRRRILFVAADRSRKVIRLGKTSHRQAESVKIKIEDLVTASITGHSPSDETARWLAGLDEQLYDKLFRVGLTRRRESATLGDYTRSYIDGRCDIKKNTRTNLELCRSYLLEHFEATTPLRDISPGDAQDFRLHMIRSGRSEGTVRRAIGRARQFLTAAIQHRLITANPFEGMAAAVRSDPARFYFITRDEAAKVLDTCPDAQWRLIFALARYGGLRCPGEVLALTWGDVHWDTQRIRVPSEKTEHIAGKASRIIPMFPELKPYLLDCFEQAEPGTEYVITRYRVVSANLRTQLHRIIKRAGLEPWPKTFQNLRSTRQTELSEQFPAHVVCKWIGNSEPVAAEHYLQLTDEHFERAIIGDEKAAHNPAQQAHASGCTDKNKSRTNVEKSPCFVGSYDDMPLDAGMCKNATIPPRGIEPLSSG